MSISTDQWHKIWDVIHIFAKTFIPTPSTREAFQCFFECLCDLLPDISARNNLRSFMQQTPINDYTSCSNKAFEWTFKLHNYINVIKKRQGYNTPLISLEKAFDNYQYIDKVRWANPTWFLIHFIFANLPETLTREDKINIKAFLVCIDYLIPCSECKNHMKEYLSHNSIDPYSTSKYNAFQWSWKFHNAVNERLKKPSIGYSEALQYYTIPKYQIIDDSII